MDRMLEVHREPCPASQVPAGRQRRPAAVSQISGLEQSILLFDQAPIGAMLLSIDLKVLKVNRALCDLLGYDESALVGVTYTDVLYDEDSVAAQPFSDLLNGNSSPRQVERRYIHMDGRVLWATEAISLVRDKDGAPQVFMVQIVDLTQRRAYEVHLERLAGHDPLTDLPNRRLFFERLSKWTKGAGFRPDCPKTFAVMILDVDRFKQINDTWGHPAGDKVLSELSSLLRRNLRPGDMVARLGGDEFAILMPDVDMNAAAGVASRLVRAVKEQGTIVDGQQVNITASIGVALFPRHGLTAEVLISRADKALYEAKAKGRDNCCLYSALLRENR